MGFFRYLFGLTPRTEAIKAEIETELEGVRDDIREARRRNRIAWGLDVEPEAGHNRLTNGSAKKKGEAK